MDNYNLEEHVNIHQVVQEASTEMNNEADPLVVQTFKISKVEKELVSQICEKHGITPSKFYQKCAETLIAGYIP